MLQKIQTVLKAPKNAFNKHGKYNYRKAEDILTALKPHLEDHKAYLLIADEQLLIGEWHYTEATVTLYDENNNVVATTKAAARESESRKGMDASQITGTASSYARKYALNGMFLIDDTDDADSMDNNTQRTSGNGNDQVSQAAKSISPEQYSILMNLIVEKGQQVETLTEHYKIASLTDLPIGAYNGLIEWLKGL